MRDLKEREVEEFAKAFTKDRGNFSATISIGQLRVSYSFDGMNTSEVFIRDVPAGEQVGQHHEDEVWNFVCSRDDIRKDICEDLDFMLNKGQVTLEDGAVKPTSRWKRVEAAKKAAIKGDEGSRMYVQIGAWITRNEAAEIYRTLGDAETEFQAVSGESEAGGSWHKHLVFSGHASWKVREWLDSEDSAETFFEDGRRTHPEQR